VSYYTRITFDFSDVPPGAEEASTVVRSWLMAQNLYAVDDVLADFLRGWTDGYTEFSDLVSQDIEGLMQAVSVQYPTIRFYVRGMGENFNDVWLRQFQNGKIVFTLGPFAEAEG
jgi:hypothetical protein